MWNSCQASGAITIQEALNATHFADKFSVRGVLQCAVFTMGASWLKDVNLIVGLSEVDVQEVKVPYVTVTFTDEKYMDLRGDRITTDKPYCNVYAEGIWSSPAY